MMNKIADAIRAILMARRDPIGVRDEPGAADEYDSYVGGVSQLLGKAASAAEIAARLLEIERAEMGLPGDAARAERAAKALDHLRNGR